MQLSKVAFLSNDKINSSYLDVNNYLSTDNMLPNIGGYVRSAQLPEGNVTKFIKNDILLSNIRPYFKKLVFATIDQ